MEPEVKQDSSPEFNTPESGPMRKLSSSEQAQEQWQQFGEQVTKFIGDIPTYFGEFFNEYRQPIVVIGLFLALIVVMKITFAILGAINEIPLLAPTFEIIGIGYAGWFVYRYLLKASTRTELTNDFASLKEQVLGQRDQLMDRLSPKESKD